MARPSTAARRYAEAAFELASRDGALDVWRDGLAVAVQLVSDERVAALGLPGWGGRAGGANRRGGGG